MNNDRSSPFLNLEKIYQENFHYLSSYLINLTSNKQLTEDIIQETFLKLLKSPEKIKQVSYIRSWLVVNVRNTLIDHYRKKSPSLLRDDEKLQRLLIDNYHPERKLIINASIEILLNELSEEDQTIFILKEYYGYRYEEISNIVSMPVPTIKTRMFRMKKKLLQTAGGDDF